MTRQTEHADAVRSSDDERRWRAHVPNGLTCLRVVLAGVFVWYLHGLTDFGSELSLRYAVNVYLIATTLFVIAAITDAVDGYLARRWEVISAFGRVMDPFADKVLVLGAFVMFSGIGLVPAWMTVVILARELLVTSIRGLIEASGVSFAAGASGKVKMVVQSVAIPLLMLIEVFWMEYYIRWGENYDDVRHILEGVEIAKQVVQWLVLVVTVWSGVPYVTRGMKLIAKKDETVL